METSITTAPRGRRMVAAAWAVVMATSGATASAARIEHVSPQGEVAQVRQVMVRFDEAVVPLGQTQAAAPMRLACTGPAPEHSARWTSDREWVLDFRRMLPPGVRCTLEASEGWQPLKGALTGPTRYAFGTGGPAIVRSDPWDGATIAEDQHFLLHLNGPATAASVRAQVWCEVEGLGERIGVRIVDGAPRTQILAARRVPARQAESALVLACDRTLPTQAKLRLVWGAGVASAADPAVLTRTAQRLRFQVRERFAATFSCERENAQAPCMPLAPAVLQFSAPVPRATAQALRLVPQAGGTPIAPRLRDEDTVVARVEFPAPLPENTRLRLVLPAQVSDDAGRPLANAAAFPLEVNIGPTPPIAKFAASPFGIVEHAPDAALPVTLRHVQAELARGAVRISRIDDTRWLEWMGRLAQADRRQFESRKKPLLADGPGVRRLELPQLQGSEPRPFEVVGIPLQEPGYHVVEIESKVLGQRLLAPAAPMFVHTGVLVTNMGVHFKHGRENAQVWVTTLDRAQPVEGADVAVHDCRGKPLWQGRTDAQGLAAVPLALPVIDGSEDEPEEPAAAASAPTPPGRCPWQSGYFVTAARDIVAADGRRLRDRSFVFSNWNRGIEAWRFGLPTQGWGEPQGGDRLRVHTVFDRTLLRAGETASMKHFVRLETRAGLRDVPAENRPDAVRIVHAGSGDEVVLPLRFDAAGRAALSSWSIAPSARLGLYEVSLKNARHEWPAGRLRVEEFRVPLLQARLAAPRQPQVAPQAVPLAMQLNHLSGGPAARAPLRVSAVLRDRVPDFAGYETWSFQPPRAPGGRDAAPGDADDTEGDGARLVVDRQAQATDAQGAATLQLAGWPALKRPGELQAEVSFDDPNGEVQTVATRVPLWPAARVVGVRAGHWIAAKGRVKFQAVVLDLDGRPLADAPVTVQARLTQWQAQRKRLVGGFYAYDQQATRKELGTVCEGRSDARGLVLCEAALDAAGDVELVARASDEAGRISEAATSVWVTRRGEIWFEQDNDDRIDVLADKVAYEPGDTARLQVRMPYRQATALVSVEREGVVSSRVVTLQGSDPTIDVPIPRGGTGGDAQASSWAPNVFISVLVLRGRVRHVPWYSAFQWGWRNPIEWWQAFRHEGPDHAAPTATVDLARPSHKFGAVQLRVGLQAHRLDVKVEPERSQYGVRETVRTRVRVTHGGQPAAGAEIAFAAVDEALLELQDNDSWKLLEGMFPPRAWGVDTATAQGEIVGRRHYGRKAVPAGGGGGRNPTRDLFDTLLLWRGAVVLDAKGEAVIDVPLNDSLTGFRLVALASAGPDRFGTGSASVRVSQDLQMLPGLPPLAREGDRYDAIYTLRNTTAAAMRVRATLSATAQRGDAGGFSRQPLAFEPQTVELAAGAAAQVRWPVQVPAGVFSLVFEAAVDAGAAKDRVKTTQMVQAAVPVRVWAATLRQIDAPLELPVAPPPEALPADAAQPAGARAGGVNVGLQATLAGALPGVRRFFEQYPHTCLEQQSSRALALADAAGWERLMGALPGYLDADGLAQYYPVRPGDPPYGSDRLTAHLLSAAHEAGQAIPQASRERMQQALLAFVEGRLERRGWSPDRARGIDLDVRRLAALEALSRHGQAQPRHLQVLQVAPALWPTAAVIDWLQVLRRLEGVPQREAWLQQAQAQLRARITYAGSTLRFSQEEADDWWWLMDSPDANAARLILAVHDDPAWKDEVPRLVIGALARQQRAAWRTTVANLWGTLALQRFAARFERHPVSGRSMAILGGARATHDWAPAVPAAGGAVPAGSTGGARLALPWPPAVTAAAPATLSLTHEGSGRPWAAVQALAAVPLKAPVAAGYRINRTVRLVEGGAPAPASTASRSPGFWVRGDALRVRLEIEAQSDMTWVALVDPLPAGATILGSGLGRDSALATRGERREGSGWMTFEERGHDAWRHTWGFLPRGRHVVEYTMRLNSAGRLHLPPSRIEAMYAPDVFGELPLEAMEVRP